MSHPYGWDPVQEPSAGSTPADATKLGLLIYFIDNVYLKVI